MSSCWRIASLVAALCSSAGPAAAQHPRLVRLRNRPGLLVRCPHRAWGSPLSVKRLEQLADAYRRRFPAAPPLQVHDVSRQHGGPMSRHSSHRAGHDVDIRLLLLREPGGYVDATARTLDVERTWFVIIELVRTCDVEFILLDRALQRPLWRYALRQGLPTAQLELILEYPNRPTGRHPARLQDAIVRHLRGHANHMHVRFRVAERSLRGHGARQLCGYAVF